MGDLPRAYIITFASSLNSSSDIQSSLTIFTATLCSLHVASSTSPNCPLPTSWPKVSSSGSISHWSVEISKQRDTKQNPWSLLGHITSFCPNSFCGTTLKHWQLLIFCGISCTELSMSECHPIKKPQEVSINVIICSIMSPLEGSAASWEHRLPWEMGCLSRVMSPAKWQTQRRRLNTPKMVMKQTSAAHSVSLSHTFFKKLLSKHPFYSF